MSQQPGLCRENGLWAQGYRFVAGLDEAGRGAWAGPVVAAAVILPCEHRQLASILAPVRDSKLLTPRQRDICYDLILQIAVSHGVGAVPAAEIDRIGIVPATRRAMALAIAQLHPAPDYLLIDAVQLPSVDLPQCAVPKADRQFLSVAAASVVAKVTRDRFMLTLENELPGYGLARHKGYGTRLHLQALHALGPTRWHRHSFSPIRALCQTGPPGEADDGH